MNKTLLIVTLLSLLLITGSGTSTEGAVFGRCSLIAWNDLGMHCMDHDYSVFAILPPYNNLHAQLIDGMTGRAVTSGVTITYEAVTDTHGSINSTSSGKTNFWDWVFSLFGASPPVNMGLAGNPAPSASPAPMTYDVARGFWKAEGIPLTPYDNALSSNYYPMVKVVAKDLAGNILATTKVVLPVSDEINCSHCHSSGIGDPAAQPSPDWVYDPNPDKDWKRNILLLHDNRNGSKALFADAIGQSGYAAAGLLITSDMGTPILCARCHRSNALGTTGVTGIKQLTTSIHSWHATHAMDDNTGMPMDLTLNRTACYYCHPGSTTQCLRGTMGIAKNPDGTDKLECQSCHGVMSKVGMDGRSGWIDLPKCQNCHYQGADGNYVRDVTAFDLSGNFRQAVSIFSSDAALFKVGATHGKMQCEACHGSTHAEYATSEDNDNVQSIQLQGYAGVIAECVVCHPRGIAAPGNKGPHGLHVIGTPWLLPHSQVARTGTTICTSCHGMDYRGTKLSKAFKYRTFTYYFNGMGRKTYAKGEVVGCYDCHNGPTGH